MTSNNALHSMPLALLAQGTLVRYAHSAPVSRGAVRPQKS